MSVWQIVFSSSKTTITTSILSKIDNNSHLGDRIQVSGFVPMKVSHIGLLSTTGHTRNGELLIVPNTVFQTSIVTSFKRSKNYRVVLKMRVDARTPLEKLERLKSWLLNWCRNDGQVKQFVSGYVVANSDAYDRRFGVSIVV
jgi:small-conductance mechanosensitive channel